MVPDETKTLVAGQIVVYRVSDSVTVVAYSEDEEADAEETGRVTGTGTEVVNTVEYLLVRTEVERLGQSVTDAAQLVTVISVVVSTVTVEALYVVVTVEAPEVVAEFLEEAGTVTFWVAGAVEEVTG